MSQRVLTNGRSKREMTPQRFITTVQLTSSFIRILRSRATVRNAKARPSISPIYSSLYSRVRIAAPLITNTEPRGVSHTVSYRDASHDDFRRTDSSPPGPAPAMRPSQFPPSAQVAGCQMPGRHVDGVAFRRLTPKRHLHKARHLPQNSEFKLQLGQLGIRWNVTKGLTFNRQL